MASGRLALGFAVCCTLLVATRADGRIPLVRSPYYLPGISNKAVSFADDGLPGRTFRMLGAPEGSDWGHSLTVNQSQAQAICEDIGLGLAAIHTPERRLAAQQLDAHAQAVMPDSEMSTLGCCGSFIWTAAHRETLSEAACAASNGGAWPYFTEGPLLPNNTRGEGSGYAGCGQDPIKDWVWRLQDATGNPVSVPFSDVPASQDMWGSTAETGSPSNQPQGWTGPLITGGFFAGGGMYENCTVLQTLTPSLPVFEEWTNAPVEDAMGRIYMHDIVCDAPIARWICQFESEEQGVTPEMGSALRNSVPATVANSVFYEPGVTDKYRRVSNGVIRVLGISPERAALMQGKGMFRGSPASVSWTEAQAICTWTGGSGLARVNQAADLALLKELRQEVGLDSLEGAGSPLWVGGAYFGSNQQAQVMVRTNWVWFDSWASGRAGAGTKAAAWRPSDLWAFHASRLDHNPKTSNVAESAEETLPTSCIASSVRAIAFGTESTQEGWVNLPCDEPSMHQFVCLYPNAEIGFQVADPPSSGSTGPPLALILGAAAGGLLLLVAAASGAVCCWRVRKQRHRELDGGGKHNSMHASRELETKTPLDSVDLKDVITESTQGVAEHLSKAPRGGHTVCVETLSGFDFPSSLPITSARELWQNTSSREPVQQVGQATRLQTRGDIHAILDSYLAANSKLHHLYTLLPGMKNRREGGQGVVVFAQAAGDPTAGEDASQLAIKIFGSQREFDEECRMYDDPSILSQLPKVYNMVRNDQNRLVAPNHVAVPPFIVMDRGESFMEWCARKQPDFPTSLQVLTHVSKILLQLHEIGWAHRDVKPSNVIWVPRINGWMLIDFASAAKIGTDARLSYTLPYAPPELASVLRGAEEAECVEPGGPRLRASGSVDVWALGVMAWTLLTGEHPLAGEKTCADVLDRLTGRVLFPWESALPKETRAQLGILRPTVVAMLDRNPETRITIRQVLDTWANLFQSADAAGQHA